MTNLVELVNFITTSLYVAIFARVIVTWFPTQRENPNLLVQIIYKVTEPMLQPIKKIIPSMGYIDISPMIAIILIVVIREVVSRALS